MYIQERWFYKYGFSFFVMIFEMEYVVNMTSEKSVWRESIVQKMVGGLVLEHLWIKPLNCLSLSFLSSIQKVLYLFYHVLLLTKQFVIFETFPIWSVLKLIALPQWTNIIEKSLFVFNNRYQQYLSPFTNATCIFDIKRWIKNNSQIKPSESNLFCLFRIPSDLSL